MKKQFIFLPLILAGFLWQFAIGQTPVSVANRSISNNKINGTGYFHNCGTDKLHKNKLATDPDYAKRFEEINKQTKRNYLQILRDRAKGKSNIRSGHLYTIPVVVHVMYLTGTAIGINENISDAMVQQGIQDLNDAFRNIGFYNPSTGVDSQVEFCLAVRDPDGLPSTGITRTATALSDLDKDINDQALKDLDRWNTTKYMNIWLVKEICSSAGCGVAGYAYLASAHGATYDGVVCEARWFGSNQDNSKVHIHEVGHYLNLQHTFESGCPNNDCTADGDYICDTPPDDSQTSVTCGSNPNSCTTDDDDLSLNNPFRPVGNGGLGDQNDMIENYMDYGYNECQDRFTLGQKDRMTIALTVTRASLLTSDGCTPAAPPVSNFSAIPKIVCSDSSVQFIDESVNGVTGWTWTFNGGSPASSSSQNPSILYNTPGLYNVSLMASNTQGNGNTETKTDYISVYESVPAASCTVNTDSLSNTYGMGIKNVTLQNINNSTGGAVSDNGYKNFSCSVLDTLKATNSYNISITVGSANDEDIRVYIDYNNDGSFNNTDELVYSIDAVRNTVTGSITIPNASVKNKVIRMRVISDIYGNNITNACNNSEYGQAEDYGLVIKCADDTGVPPVSDFVSDKTFGCTGTTINFSDNSQKCPDSWSWTINGGSPASSTSQNPSSTFNAAGFYQIDMTASNSYGTGTTVSKPSFIKIYDAPQAACVPFTTDLVSNFGIGIKNLTFQNINNTTGTAKQDGGYLDFSCTLIDTFRSGSSYPVSITTGAVNKEDVKIYIDWNADGTLNSTDELVFNSQDSLTTHRGVIAFPLTATNDKTLRMRVVSDFFGNNISSSCYNSENGQSEDYGIVVKCIAPAPVADFSANTTSVCDGSSVTFTDNSTNNTTWSWDFGAGASPATATTQGPHTVTYSTTGTKTISLTVENSCGDVNVKTRTDYVTVNSNPTATVTGTNPSCNGGSNGTATITASGGTPGYTYQWSSGPTTSTITGLASGTYTVTATDATTCTASGNVTLTSPTAVTATVTGTNPSCNGGSNGSATATAGGGTSPYTYAWSSGQTTSSISGIFSGSYTVTVSDSKSCSASGNVTITSPSAVTATVTGTNPSCNGGTNGSSTVTGAGGTGTFTFAWSTGATTSTTSSLPAGTYTVTVTDGNNCTATGSFTLTEPSALNVSISGTDVACNGDTNGIVDLTVSGGTSPYTYAWSGSQITEDIDSLIAGTYSVTVTDAKSCTSSGEVTINTPSALSVSVSGVNPTCAGNDGSAISTASGGTTPYTYLWNDGQSTATATSLNAGTFAVTITDANSCTASNEVSLTLSSTLAATTSVSNVLCNGDSTGSATVSPSSGVSPYTYLWSNGQTTTTATNLGSGIYTITVTDNNSCTVSTEATISEPAVLNAVVNTQQPSCNGSSDGAAQAVVSGGTTPYAYSWTTGETTQVVIGLTAGPGGVTVTDANGCADTISGNLNEPAPLTISFTVQDVLCKNDSTGSATANPSGGTSGYTYVWSSPGNPTTKILAGVAAGLYVVTVTDANSCTATDQVTITEPGSVVSASVSSTNVSCPGGNDGSATVNPAGGVSPYTFSWNDGVTSQNRTNLTAGTYSVSVTDANNCFVENTASLSQPSSFSLTFSSTDANCATSNGTVSATVSGGTPGYTYLWNDISSQTTDTAIALPAGIYTVTVTDLNNCTTSGSGTIGNMGGPTISSVVSNVSCKGGSNGIIDISVSGGTAPFTYLWADGDTNAYRDTLTAGSYTVTVTDNAGCLAALVSQVNEPALLVVSQQSVTNLTCFGDSSGSVSVTSAGGTSPYSYLWNNGETTSTVSGVAVGIYTVTVTDNNACTDSTAIVISEPDSLTFGISSTNPTCIGSNNGLIYIDTSSGGTVPYYASLNSAAYDTVYSFGNLAPGSYSVDFKDDNGCMAVQQTVNLSYATTVDAGSAENACSTDSAFNVIVGNPAGGFWTGIGIVDSNNGTFDPSISGAGTITLTYSVIIDTSTCFGSKDVTVSTPSPAPVINCGTTTISSIEWIWNSLPGATGYEVSRDGGTNWFTASGLSEDTTGLTPAEVLTISVRGVFAGVCNYSDMDSKTCFAFNCIPVAVNVTSDTSICAGSSAPVGVLNVSGGFGPFSYSWSGPDSLPDLAGPHIISPVANSSYIVFVTDDGQPGCPATSESINITVNPGLSVSLGSENETCFGSNDGFANISVSGAVGNLSYLWSNSATDSLITGLSAGTYTCTVTDDSTLCQVSASVDILPAAAFSGNLTITNVTCNGDSDGVIVATISGGVGGYTYTWNTLPAQYDSVISNLPAGNYSLSVYDANNCELILNGVVNDAPFTISLTTGNVSCNGGTDGSVNANVSGGTSPYSYFWDSGETSSSITNLTAGTYILAITDANSCTDTVTATVNEPPLLVVSVTGINPSCSGEANGSALAIAGGGTIGYTYGWSFGATGQSINNIVAGTYSVTVYDANNCTATGNVTLTQPSALTLTLTTNNPTGCSVNDGSLNTTASGGTSPYTYLWSNASTNQSISGLSAGTYTVTTTDSNNCTSSASTILISPNSPTVSVTGTNPFCNGSTNGSATATPGGGASPYIFVWSTGVLTSAISLITDGTYTVTVTAANNCTTSGTVTLTSPLVLTGTLSSTNVTCNGNANGIIISSVSGGTSGYTYIWSTIPAQTTSTATGLISGTYTVTVTDSKSCTVTLSANVTQPMALSVTLSKTDPTCSLANGSADATVSGGTVPYSYLWSNATALSQISNVSGGTYTLTVTDANGCTISKNISLANLTGPSAFVSGSNITCNGGTDGTATATVSGGSSPYSYLWSGGQSTASITGLVSGTYTVTITDSKSCTSSFAVNISQPLTLSISLLTKTDASCAGNFDGSISVTVSGGNGTYNYFWSTMPQQITSTAINLGAGSYIVTVTDIKGCTASSDFSISTDVGVTLSVSVSSPTCFDGSNGSASVFPSSGTGPFSYSWNTGETAQFISNLSAGDYFVTATDSKQCTVVENVVITAPAPPTVDFSADVTQIDSGGVVNFTNISPSVISSGWFFGDGDSSVATNPSHQYNATGLFSVTLRITTSGFCTNSLIKTDYIKVDKLIDIPENIHSGKIHLYPVPAKDYLIVNVPSQFVNGKFSIVDITGKEILKINATAISNKSSSSEANYRLEISSLAKGFYLLKVGSDTGARMIGFQRVE